MRTLIPKVVFDHLAGAEIYPESAYLTSNPPAIRARAIEDAEFLLAINFDGYEDYPQPATANACHSFIKKAKKGVA